MRGLRSSLPAALALVLLAWSVSAQAPSDRARTEDQARRASDRLEALKQEADRLASEERTLLTELRRLELDQAMKAERVAKVTAERDQAARDVASTAARIEALERRQAAERPMLRRRLVELYKLGRARYLRLALGAADARQLARAVRLIAALAEADRRRLVEYQRTVDSLVAAERELEARQRQLEQLRADAAAAAQAAAEAVRARRDRVREIDARRDLNAQLAGELLAVQQKLQATLRDLASGGAAAAPAVLPIRAFRGALDWPVAGPVRRGFGAAGQRPPSNGIEIASPAGTPVRAVHEGTVAFADVFSGFGRLVILDHGSQTFSVYGDLQAIAVARGGQVERGQVLGEVGTAPAGEAGLYFEIRVDGRPVDPLEWLKKR